MPLWAVKLNSWGTPDWRDAAAYGDTEAWPNYRWRWEFLRRRDDSRADFDRCAEITYQSELSSRRKLNEVCNGNLEAGKYTPQEIDYLTEKLARMGPPLTPDKPGFIAIDIEDEFLLLPRKYGVAGLLNPRISVQPDDLMRRFDRENIKIPSLLGRSPVRLHGKPIDSMPVNSGQMAILFFLDKPIDPQLAEAKELLHSDQKDIYGKVLRTRSRPGKWLRYLRALDGREAGASWAEINKVLFPNITTTPQTARDTWKQARDLCFNF